MSDQPDLLPCPFCGGPASHIGAAIRCNSFACNASMTPRWTKNVVGSAKGNPDVQFALAKADCTKRWNGRVALQAGQLCNSTVEMAECAAFSAGYEAGERDGGDSRKVLDDADLLTGDQWGAAVNAMTRVFARDIDVTACPNVSTCKDALDAALRALAKGGA